MFLIAQANKMWLFSTRNILPKVNQMVRNIQRAANAVLVLVQRRRRWSNTKTAFAERPVFAGISLAPVAETGQWHISWKYVYSFN